ncbi:aminotransferase class I/II-fold pyridoxal phosphate-dependent enzyme [Aestuariibius sp. HNIBRBA575]|uniref:aminotransferase class I/II-fold pyridoxal phosphate-dependent enzyme n=1 Tax=Aestuariibius sp. HNIBRBA575 TaxID=3233343 RepID=UPI0034A29A13
MSKEQKTQLTDLMGEKEHIVVFDMAYQGFGSTIDENANFVRSYSETGLPCFIVNNFSKNMSIYGERAGGLNAVCETPSLAKRTLSQCQLITLALRKFIATKFFST